MHLDARQLHNALMEKYPNMHPYAREHIYKTIRSQQARRANHGRRKAQVQKWWADIMAEAQREKRSARASLDHDSGDEARYEAFSAYLAVIKRVLADIKGYKSMGLTPKRAQAWRIENNKKPYPNGLTHWTDMVPEKVRLSITEAFNALPYRAKAKRKTPFMRDNNDNWGEQ
jgi:hypothetical protein